jgi:hypothetical protein
MGGGHDELVLLALQWLHHQSICTIIKKSATTFGISSGVALIILAETREISDGFDFQNMNLKFN